MTGESTSASTTSGLRAILVATVVAGAVGYAIQGVVARAIRPDDYLGFSVFWSTLYLVIAALSGLQQEVTRATRPVQAGGAASRLLPFGAATALVVGVALAATAPLWGPLVFTRDPWLFVALWGLGAVAYVGVALLSGVFYGLQAWRGVAGMTIVDALVRLVLIVLALLLGASPGLLAAAVVVPFPVTLGILWLVERHRVSGRFALDVGGRELAWNALRAVGGSVSTGVLTSGFPLMIGATSRHEPEALVGALVFVVTLTRAPLVVPALALQSYLTVVFRDQAATVRAALGRLLAAVMGVSVVVAAGAWLFEPWLLQAIWGEKYVVSATTCAGIVLTAGLTAALCVSGPATLATNRHGAYLAGWASAAVVTVVVLLVPLPLEQRVLASMALGPVVGVAVHWFGLAPRGAAVSA